MEILVHECKKQPNDVPFDNIERDKDGVWWVVRNELFGGLIPRARITKVQQLVDGRCPWCRGDLAWLAQVWPHNCPKKGEGARALITESSNLPVAHLQIDGDQPTQAVYTATYKFVVKVCPDCGIKLFEE